ncbi:CHASE2 domain-containing protein [Desulfobotulus mexicanus]|uniref:Adenylate/guanylate cyclase domain-containing protein n=1 Tax=Desulfobotulus mexicanus TaxID=2586642 RepID=A0A5S5MFJ7_9BACT|nr:adenylate/guanylate cyclase domain-containing protein [Desulfobotulus mexicanus]TYT74447.1 adenylate/guanylate cyclase domain-containing protein [Desulfobotulus mexicanus]
MTSGSPLIRILYRTGLATSLAMIFVMILSFTGLLDRMEWKTFDIRAQMMAKPSASTKNVVLILVDQNSLDWARETNHLSWPWPREIWAYILDFCQSRGAKAVGLDILFTEPSIYGEYDDAALAAASRRFGSVAGAIFLGDSTGAATVYPETHPQPPPFLGTQPPERKRASLAHGDIAASWGMPGNVGLNPDPDGIYRNVRLFTTFDGKVFPSLGLATWMAAHPHIRPLQDENTIYLDHRTIPLNSDHEARLRFRGPSRSHPSIPAAAILRAAILEMQGKDPELPEADLLKNAYVLVGYSAPGLHDLTPVPVGGAYPGVEVHATLLDNFLEGDFLRDISHSAFYSITILLTGFCAFIPAALPAMTAALAALSLALLLPVTLSFSLYGAGVVLPLLTLMAGTILASVTVIFINYTTEGKQKRFIKNAFSQYLSPAVIDELLINPEKLKLGGEKREITIFFSDLEGFTSISEGMDPEHLTSFLNHYLSAMTDIILESGGTVDKYEGDAIIAFWNAPLALKDHADRAVQAALRCQDALRDMADELRKWTHKKVRMRIGINTGDAVVGNLGSSKRFDYTMLGDSVNLAARLEGVNKIFGTYTLISESTASAMGPSVLLREIARVRVVGKEKPIRIYEPGWAEADNELIPLFNEAREAFARGKFREAAEKFQALAEKDAPSLSYTKKCRELIDHPPAEWQGIWVMDQK